VGSDNETECGPRLRPERYYLIDDAGSFFFDPAGGNDGFESPEAAVAWARSQDVYRYDEDIDLSDPMVTSIAKGSEFNANAEAVERLLDEGRLDISDPESGWSEVPGVHNYAEDLGLVRVDPRRVVRRRRGLLGRLRWR
jgi:hypothetical protein